MLVVGLTGGIATGKSTVSSLLKSYHVPLVDADVLAREVVLPGTKAHSQIVSLFGQRILLPDGSLDRPKLGAEVFNDKAKRDKLNSIVHPAVRRAMIWKVMVYWLKGERVCAVDVPLLIEAGLWKWVGKVVLVYCSQDLQLQRLMSRDNSERDAALSRINAQLAISEKVPYADVVIDNSGSPQALERQVDSLVRLLKKEVRWTWMLSWIFPPVGLVSGLWTLLWRGAKRNAVRRGWICKRSATSARN